MRYDRIFLCGTLLTLLTPLTLCACGGSTTTTTTTTPDGTTSGPDGTTDVAVQDVQDVQDAPDGEGYAREEDPAQDANGAVDAPDEVQTAAALRWDAAAIAEVEGSLPGMINEFMGEEGGPMRVRRLAVSDLRERTFVAFVVVLQTELGEASFLAIASPGTQVARVELLALGEADYSPGTDSSRQVMSPEAFRFALEGGVLRASVTVQSAYAEAATDGECQQRAQDETVATTTTVLCPAGQPCASIPTEVSVIEPGYDQDCRGRRRARPVETQPYRVRLTWPASDRLGVVGDSGAPPADLIGEFDLRDVGVAIGEELTLIIDE